MAQQLRVLAALAKDSGSVANPNMGDANHH